MVSTTNTDARILPGYNLDQRADRIKSILLALNDMIGNYSPDDVRGLMQAIADLMKGDEGEEIGQQLANAIAAKSNRVFTGEPDGDPGEYINPLPIINGEQSKNIAAALNSLHTKLNNEITADRDNAINDALEDPLERIYNLERDNTVTKNNIGTMSDMPTISGSKPTNIISAFSVLSRLNNEQFCFLTDRNIVRPRPSSDPILTFSPFRDFCFYSEHTYNGIYARNSDGGADFYDSDDNQISTFEAQHFYLFTYQSSDKFVLLHDIDLSKKIYQGHSSEASSAIARTATIADFPAAYAEGQLVLMTFGGTIYGTEVDGEAGAAHTLDINGMGAKLIYFDGDTSNGYVSTVKLVEEGTPVLFRYINDKWAAVMTSHSFDSSFAYNAKGNLAKQITYSGTCTTAEATAAKKVSVSGFPSTLSDGLTVRVRFANDFLFGESGATLSINGGTAIPIYLFGDTSSIDGGATLCEPNGEIEFVYNADAAVWTMIGSGLAWHSEYARKSDYARNVLPSSALDNILNTMQSETDSLSEQIDALLGSEKWSSGTEINHVSETKNYSFAGDIGDMYLNTETITVYRCNGEKSEGNYEWYRVGQWYKDTGIAYDDLSDGLKVRIDNIGNGIVDDELNENSHHPVANSVITAEVNALQKQGIVLAKGEDVPYIQNFATRLDDPSMDGVPSKIDVEPINVVIPSFVIRGCLIGNIVVPQFEGIAEYNEEFDLDTMYYVYENLVYNALTKNLRSEVYLSTTAPAETTNGRFIKTDDVYKFIVYCGSAKLRGQSDNLIYWQSTDMNEDIYTFYRNDYSSTPTKIGMWVDGTPIWRVAFKRNFTATEATNRAVNIIDLLPVVDVSGNDEFILNEYIKAYYLSPSLTDDIKGEVTAGAVNFANGKAFDTSSDGIYGWIEFVTPTSNINIG